MTKRCLLTGAASGIGQCVVDALVADGSRVIATDINEDGLAAAAAAWPEDQVRLRGLDVTSETSWQAAFAAADDAWGGTDVLFNIAGYLTPGYVHESELSDVHRHIDINVKGVMFGTRIAAERMVRRGSGHIVNIASMAAFGPIAGLSLYCASKYAVRAYSLAAAIELKDKGVAVTVVCPDAVATPMLDKQKDYEEASLTFSGPRVLTPEEVAAEIVGPVLRNRPMEVALPRSRKWLARVLDTFPELAPLVSPLFVRQGSKKRSRYSR
jgi:3-oxoacyl-[acyl-carrier protein] reductase